jgi:hypothetical protein
LDAVFAKVVNFVMPSRVVHLHVRCKREEVAFKSFLTDHFKLGGGFSNPRMVLLFMGYAFEDAAAYYTRNPDSACRLVQPNAVGEYELILQEHVLRGYKKLQVTMRETIAHLNETWRAPINRLFINLSSPHLCNGIDIEQLKKYTEWTSADDEFRRFIAFYNHVGLLACENESAQFENRKYTLPLALQICPGS